MAIVQHKSYGKQRKTKVMNYLVQVIDAILNEGEGESEKDIGFILITFPLPCDKETRATAYSNGDEDARVVLKRLGGWE